MILNNIKNNIKKIQSILYQLYLQAEYFVHKEVTKQNKSLTVLKIIHHNFFNIRDTQFVEFTHLSFLLYYIIRLIENSTLSMKKNTF